MSKFTFFFFQAEDGIRYFHVTGVQTCALPILAMLVAVVSLFAATSEKSETTASSIATSTRWPVPERSRSTSEIGRASCREREYSPVVAAASIKKQRG